MFGVIKGTEATEAKGIEGQDFQYEESPTDDFDFNHQANKNDVLVFQFPKKIYDLGQTWIYDIFTFKFT